MDKFDNVVLFPDKLKKANETISKIGLPNKQPSSNSTEEIKRLKGALRRAEQERDILKKAIKLFSKEKIDIPMDITQNDIAETKDMAKLLNKIDHIDAEYVTSTSDEMFQKQPFFLEVFLGYRFDVTPMELEEIMKVFFLIWEYFRTNKKVQTIKVTQAHFEAIQDKNIDMLQHASGGKVNDNKKLKIYSSDLDNLKSKALFSAVLFRFNERLVLMQMEENKRGILFLGIKSFIDCFENL